ncbi:MAG: hypothetical protein IT360_10565 [Gemmatimonadaceae bacterium]|nr:hypothetical protein [Gemmatimonadaceae bacterium]
MRPRVMALLAVAVAGTSVVGQAPNREVENVASFARLYGVVRYFYPSDAAASVDWDRFALHGVQRLRAVPDPGRFAAALAELVRPLGPGITIAATLPVAPGVGAADPRLVSWRYLGAGVGGSGAVGPYRAKRTNRELVVHRRIDGFATLMQTLPAGPNVRGRTIRLRGRVRSAPRDATGTASLWLRIDRPGQQMGFFDNMGNRPIREPEWREYAIEGSVAEDATNVAFGVMASGSVAADFDSVDLAVRGSDGSWTAIPVVDAGFEAASSTAAGVWFRAGTSKLAEIARVGTDAPEGRQFLRVAAPSSVVSRDELFDAVPTAGAFVDVELEAGLRARVPLALSDVEARVTASPELAALREALGRPSGGGVDAGMDGRLADVVVAWNVYRHFYPYWPETGVDWDTRLVSHLDDAKRAATRDGQRDALQRLVADARDGHGRVVDTRSVSPRAWLPVRFAVVGGQLVIAASGLPDVAPVGAVVSTLGGAPATKRVAELKSLASGSDQWTESRALQELSQCPKGTALEVVLDTGAGPRTSRVSCESPTPASDRRPGPVTETSPGTWYVDLTRASMTEITPVLSRLASATGIVFDVRGYPTDAGAQMLPHLVGAPEDDRWMHVPQITGPFGRFDRWQSVGWNLTPATPKVAGRVVFLTDARAISYAESVMGYVADRKLATIVGGATAGTNGDVASFTVPSGFTITFTGMRVTRHDGRTPFHLRGVTPDLPVEPTIGGLRAGRDELLERALAVIHAR